MRNKKHNPKQQCAGKHNHTPKSNMEQWCIDHVQLVLAVLANVILSVGLVFVNKAIVFYFNFRFMTVLSCLHFLASSMMAMLLVVFSCVPFKLVNNYFHLFRIALVSDSLKCTH